ncbi:hypothetical protein [Alicyclobacillus sp. SP_1]|uniref:hypothetical protein n=1 Tax=Alicyclobacillus sp. SP_1 TaxID=2942475 RepID=UPI002157C6AA|nr:hypothetical protein [Alicyclobacillus sp. SP_1]
MKKAVFAAGAAVAMTLGMSVPTVMAATPAKSSASVSHVAMVNGWKVVFPRDVMVDGKPAMPVWYAIEALHDAGFVSQWNKGSWDITTTGKVSTDAGLAKSGAVDVVVNGSSIGYMPGSVHVDPFSHKPTLYVSVADIGKVAQAIGLTSNWKSGEWSAVGPKVAALGQAMTNTVKSPAYQMSGTSNLTLSVVRAAGGSAKLSTHAVQVPLVMHMVESLMGEVGIVDGMRAERMTETMTSSSLMASGKAMTITAEQYVIGSHLYMKLVGPGQSGKWQTVPLNASLSQLLQSPASSVPLSLSLLRDITVSTSGKATVYHAALNSKGLTNYIEELESSLQSSMPSSSVSPKELASVLGVLLHEIHASTTMTVENIGGEPRLHAETAHVDLTIDAKDFGSLAPVVAEKLQSLTEKDNISLTYAYANVPVTAPTGLPSTGTTTTTGTTYGTGSMN